MIVAGIQMKMITKYISSLVYILLYLSRTQKSKQIKSIVNNALVLLYGPMWAVSICGVIINNFYHKKIKARDKTSTIVRIGSDIFGHILPVILIYLYGPTERQISPLISPLIYTLIYTLIIMLFFFTTGTYLVNTYIGVPKNLILIVAPLICLLAFYIRFIY